ncbi:MAG TPA: ABC-2 family transporter protein [Chthonomonadaceae bacterium]|nr:ABC-2 family transporter protein [Chthonomonadaceae bacterium]
MSAYMAILSARFRMLLQYRAAAFAGFATQLFWGLIRVMIFEAFYRSTTQPQPMQFSQVVTYVWLSQALLGMIPWNVDSEVRGMIRTGTVVYELARPLDLYALWYTRAIAQRSAPTVLRAIPMFIVAGLLLGMQPPPSPASAAAWVVATVGALLLSAALTTLMTLSLLWTISGEGIVRLMAALVTIFSGLVLPLPLFPNWAQPVLNFLPFRGIIDAPLRVYMGHIPPAQIGAVLAHQIGWTLALALLERALLARGTRRLVVQGG